MVTKKKRITRILSGVIVLWVVIHLIYSTLDGVGDYKGSADIAVVLGNRVDADSSLSPVLEGRVNKALLLYKQGRVRRIMVSGGLGLKAGKVPEGMAMKRYLIQYGVPADRIVEDNYGENTYLTALDFKKVNDSLHCSSVIVVSTFYHITRCKYIFRKLGIQNVKSASSDVFYANDLIGLLREFPAFYKYMLFY
ncbi:MAG TPA: YdcF family protein [Puia sp.]|jgi:vancomycin permeability regulator SanA